MLRKHLIFVSIRYKRVKISQYHPETKKIVDTETATNSPEAKEAYKCLNEGPIRVIIGQYGVTLSPCDDPNMPTVMHIQHKGRKRAENFIY